MGTWTPGPSATPGNDTFTGDATGEVAAGGDGNDSLFGGGGNDQLFGEAGDDILFVGDGSTILSGGDGSDEMIISGVGSTVIDGGAGDDLIRVSGQEVATIDGGAGIDVFDVHSATILAGSTMTNVEIFVLRYSGITIDAPSFLSGIQAFGALGGSLIFSAPVTLDLSTAFVPGNFILTLPNALPITVTNALFVFEGSSGNDTLILPNSAGAVVEAYGGNGDDALTGGAAADRLFGEAADDVLNGGGGDDSIYGGVGNDTLNGGDLNDSLTGGAGNDTLSGGNGTDIVFYEDATSGIVVSLNITAAQDTLGAGIDTLFNIENIWASPFDDVLTGSNLTNTLSGGAGSDELYGLGASDTLNGGDGRDFAGYTTAVVASLATPISNTGEAAGDIYISIEGLIGSADGDVLSGNSGDNFLRGNGGNDTLAGGDGVDTLDGGAGADSLDGGDYDDTLIADNLDTLVRGGNGYDWVYYIGTGNITLDAGANGVEVVVLTDATGNDTINAATLASSFTVYAAGGADLITGSSNDDNLYGQGGNDTIGGGGGNDLIWGEGGADSLSGGANDDTLIADALDTLVSGGAGLDWVYYVGAGNVTLNAGASGIEVVVLTDASGNDTIDAATQTAVFSVYAAGGSDTLTGGSNNDNLYGQDGNDTIVGGDGNDTIWGEAGADSLSGGNGDDTIIADSTDTLVSGGGGINDWVYFIGSGSIAMDAGAAGVEVVFTNGGADNLNAATQVNNFAAYAGDGDDVITGGSGNDGLFGQDGNDTIVGGLGNDVLLGENGNDRLTGGGGGDILAGGAGADTFVFAAGWGGDSVLDFQNGADQFDVRGLAGNGVHAITGLGISIHGADAWITWNSDLIVVANAAGLLDSSDFLFS